MKKQTKGILKKTKEIEKEDKNLTWDEKGIALMIFYNVFNFFQRMGCLKRIKNENR